MPITRLLFLNKNVFKYPETKQPYLTTMYSLKGVDNNELDRTSSHSDPVSTTRFKYTFHEVFQMLNANTLYISKINITIFNGFLGGSPFFYLIY